MMLQGNIKTDDDPHASPAWCNCYYLQNEYDKSLGPKIRQSGYMKIISQRYEARLPIRSFLYVKCNARAWSSISSPLLNVWNRKLVSKHDYVLDETRPSGNISPMCFIFFAWMFLILPKPPLPVLERREEGSGWELVWTTMLDMCTDIHACIYIYIFRPEWWKILSRWEWN